MIQLRGLARAGLLWLALMGAAAGPLAAQQLSTGVVVSPVLTLDQDRLLEGTGASARVSAEYQRRFQELAEENRQIEADLIAEEQALTEKRPTLAPAEFRDLADAFDQKVQQVRQEQDAKEVQLQRLREVELQNFLRQITPVITAIVRERGALVLIERRAAIWSADSVDITDDVIARVNAQAPLQAGTPPAQPVPAPAPTPEPSPDPNQRP